MKNNLPLRIIEVLVLGGIVSAFLLPVIFPGEPEPNGSSSTLILPRATRSPTLA